jgi:crossover junction endodeoxyribonuclease RuvC
VVLGIDPGSRVTGWGALVVAPGGPRFLAAGIASARRDDPVPTRLAKISDQLDRVLERCRPGWVVVEQAFAHRNVRSALRLGEARGIAMARAAARGARVEELSHSEAKKAALGHGGGTKEQVARMVVRQLGVGELAVPHDATDALALALALVRRLEWRQATERASS